ncbi:hypothetical protein D3C87_290070 [compost metagenome]
MKQALLFILFLSLQFSYAQTPSSIDLLKKDRQIKNTLFSQPDSAKVYIKQILNYNVKLHDTIYLNAYTAYAYYYTLKNNTDSSSYYFKKAETFANEHKYPKQYARFLRYKANNYRKKANYKEALEILAKAEEKYRLINDEEGVAVIYGEIASNYNLMGRSEDAIPYLLKSIAILEKRNDKIYIDNVKLSLANTYMVSNNLEFAADLYKEALKGFKKQGVTKNYAVTLLNYGDCLTQLKKYTPAKKAVTEAIIGLEKFNDQQLIALGHSKLGKIELELNNLESAEKHHEIAFKKEIGANSERTTMIAADYIKTLNLRKKYGDAVKVITIVEKLPANNKTTLDDKIYFESEKAITYQNINNKDKALAALKTKMLLMDSLKKIDDDLSLITIQQKYQSEYQEKKNTSLKKTNSTLKEKLKENKKIALLPILLLLIILIIIAIVSIYRSKKHAKNVILAKTDKDLLKQEYENKKKLNHLHKENIEQKLDELNSNIATLTNLEGNIHSLVVLCSENPDNLDIENIKGKLHSLIKDKDYWNLFRKRFSEAYERFQENLEIRFPNLTKNDLFFCSLLKLKLSGKDMAVLMQVSPESIIKKKYRIKKRMGIETEKELENILSSIPLD